MIETVPFLYEGPFDFELMHKLVDGETKVPGAHGIREGIVIVPVTPRHVVGLGRAQLKIVSNKFLEKDAA